MLKHILPAGLMLLIITGKAQTPLEQYIHEGITNNLVLQQKQIGIEKATLSLKEAKSLFYPSVNLNASYLSGLGGRYFNFPVGDLMNPVYQTLNQLTSTNSFPQIKNQEAYFNPKNYYDVHFRTSVPLINTSIHYNNQIQQQQMVLQEQDVIIYKRELVKQVKQAYYNYLMALKGLHIYENALVLVNKNLAVNESLLKNGKAVPANVIRAKSEADNVKSQINTAANQANTAKQYFNFLLNRSLDQDIDTAYAAVEEMKKLPLAEASITGNREELRLVNQGIAIQNTVLKMNRAYRTPQLSSFLDLGSQAVDWKFNNKSRYFLFGVQMDMPIFSGKRNIYKIDRTNLDIKNASLNLAYVEQQLQLAANAAKNNLVSAVSEYQSALSQVKSAESYFSLIDAGYKEGTNSQIEFIDARNQLTTTQLKVNIALYEVLEAYAAFERETASYTLEK